MNLGGPEVLILLLLFGLIGAILYCTVYAIIRAATNGDTPWVIGIVAGWVIGLGWVVGLVYLLTVDRERRLSGPMMGTLSTAMPTFPRSTIAPAGPTPGWHADPHGRCEQRYWDGSRWTEHVMRNGQQTTDPV
jgi:hypothetical protein